MALPSVFDSSVASGLIQRINQLTPATSPKWGKMSVGQMLAHCNVPYEMVFEPNRHPQPPLLMRLLLKTVVKNAVTNQKPYKPNLRTAPAFLQTEPKNFDREKARLVEHISKVQKMGAEEFEGRKSHSFGPLTKEQWNNMFYKHLDHHLGQFGV